MKIETMSSMIPFFDFYAVEKLSVDAVKQKFVSMEVDQRKSAVFFDNQVCEFCTSGKLVVG